jgi:hypothetical protein
MVEESVLENLKKGNLENYYLTKSIKTIYWALGFSLVLNLILGYFTIKKKELLPPTKTKKH